MKKLHCLEQQKRWGKFKFVHHQRKGNGAFSTLFNNVLVLHEPWGTLVCGGAHSVLTHLSSPEANCPILPRQHSWVLESLMVDVDDWKWLSWESSIQFISGEHAGQSILRIPCSTRYRCTLRARWGRALSSYIVNPSPTVSAKPLTIDWRMLFSYTAAVMFPSIGTSGMRQPNMTPAQNMIEPPNYWWHSTVI